MNSIHTFLNRIRRIAAVCAAVTSVAACADNLEPYDPETDGSNVIHLTLSVIKEGLTSADGTRVTFGNDGKLQWEGNESIAVIFAKKASSGTEYRYTCELPTAPGKPGVFSGSIDLGKYSASDIIGIVYPYNSHCWGKYHLSSGKKRIVMEVGAEDQIQRSSGELNGYYCPLFAEVKESDFKVSGKDYTLKGKELSWGCSLFNFLVFGKHAKGVTGEKLEAVEIAATTSICCAGTSERNIGGGFAFNGNTGIPFLATRLANPQPIGTDAASAVSLYTASMPRGENGKTVQFTHLYIITDKAVYDKVINRELLMNAGEVHTILLDISTFSRTSRSISAKAGRDSIMFVSSGPLRNRPFKVYFYSPEGFKASSSHILFAMHGAGRTGLGHLKIWESIAAKKSVFVIAPEFSKALFSNNKYQFGGISSSSSEFDPQPADTWTYSLIEELFDNFRKAKGSSRTGYDLWGHSAGGQFTHRYLLNMPEARVERAVGSNAGSFTVPDPNGITYNSTRFGFPYSIMDMNLSREQLRKFFARNFTVHIGTADTATTLEEDEDLPVSDGAEAQGACRFERGHFFYDRSKRVADSLGLPFNWKLVEVPGVGHSATKMAQTSGTGAAALLYP